MTVIVKMFFFLADALFLEGLLRLVILHSGKYGTPRQQTAVSSPALL